MLATSPTPLGKVPMNFKMRHVLRRLAVSCLVWSAAIMSGRAAQYTLLHAFAGMPTDGANPQYNANLATDGTSFYGVTLNGGTTTNKGVLFKMNLNGSGYQLLHAFNGISFTEMVLATGNGITNDGVNPEGTPLLIGSTLYGTTSFGGTNGTGTIYKINTDGGGFQLLHSFGGGGGPSDGYFPQCSLVTDGTNLFGMATTSQLGSGTIFRIGTNGFGYTTLHNFGPGVNDGASPQGSLTVSGGSLYGMTQMGGSLSSGTLFEINTDGSGFHLVHSFTGLTTDGAYPYGSVIISNTTLFGMTSAGGSNGVGTVFKVDASGSGFQILHNFSTVDTWSPHGDVTLVGGTLYGMARNGGTSLLSFGTIFSVNADGTGFQILHLFKFASPSNLTDGSTPMASLTAVGSLLYGMTSTGGSSKQDGAIFSFDPAGGGGGGSGPVTALRVTILPAAAAKAGAQWQVNGGAFFPSGAIASNLTAGAHVVNYKVTPGWVAPAPQIIDITANITNAITGTYTAADVTAPVLKVIAPTSKTIVSSNSFAASGTASDNVGVVAVFYQLNSGVWTVAASSNQFTNWTTLNLPLTAGLNTYRFYARDASGNLSPTNSVTFTYVVSAPLTVTINAPGSGTVSPSLNDTLLQIGKAYSIAAKAAKGYGFVNWTGGTNTTSSKITFLMASNLAFTANFKDITRPVNVILTPIKSQVLSNAVPRATGRAMDNAGVTAVWYRLNGGTWSLASLGDGTNWQTADLSGVLVAGPNTVAAYALDAAGNASLTNTIAFTYVVQAGADWAPNSLNGLVGGVTPGNGSPETIGFDQSLFAQTSTTNSDNSDDYGGGAYTYLKTDTNTAQLSLAYTAPPGSSNNAGAINLVFTNHYAGYFTNEESSGGINLQVATPFIPASVLGKTLTALSSHNGKTTKIKLATATAFTKTPSNSSSTGTSTGTYTFARYSPVVGVISLTFTSTADAGQTAYLQLTYTSAKGGTYYVMVFDSLGVLQDIDTGSFTM